jgi:hypothetical protein
VFADVDRAFVVHQSVENMRGFAGVRSDHLGIEGRVAIGNVRVEFHAGLRAVFGVVVGSGLAVSARLGRIGRPPTTCRRRPRLRGSRHERHHGRRIDLVVDEVHRFRMRKAGFAGEALLRSRRRRSGRCPYRVPPRRQMITATQARASDGRAPSCCIAEYRFAAPQCSVILPSCTRMASTASKWILRPVGATPRNVPWCVP